ncbi:MAG: Increased rDNA silencing protein [Thelocarpon impressellum]|nr:MAG: Increased rDNA silencing protein [Thelocarpon impressellum]
MSQFPSHPTSWLDEQSARDDGHRSAQTQTSKQFPFMTGDSLANAIVASSLASSRVPSPSKSPAPAPALPPPRRHGKAHMFNHHHNDISRTPSPAKGLRQTMRKPAKEDEEDEATKRVRSKNLIKKHPNKHHEGDRKRWRDAITERERKRYEGVWAANKGIFAGAHIPPDAVCNVVVRDVWSRSRLGADVLAEVWELVDRRVDGALGREEFVVGLWLLDQRLKGRKLPMRVSASVWDSVRRLGGVKVHGFKK